MGKNRQEQKKKAYEFFIKHQRPEEFAKDPLIYYTPERVKEYAESKSLMRIQEGITKRCVELVHAAPPALFLDIGMGCGFASVFLNLKGFRTIGLDINRFFLSYYSLPELNSIQADMREFRLRPRSIDFIISISAVQWILAESDEQKRRQYLKDFSQFCAEILKPQGKLIFQFYPKSDEAMMELGHEFKEIGAFEGNFVIDNPENPKKRRIFLLLDRL
ncbi:MAG: class I SAM-dependent methyltransferase [Candidatus Lokiarchaeota archaeon]|nr:class I SAM-dependent methyltransferase [Candidatus Harpocratesius repetitus]